MSGEDEPGGDATIHALEVFLQEVILISANVKVMLRTHHHKMDQTIVKPKPVQQHDIIKQYKFDFTLARSVNLTIYTIIWQMYTYPTLIVIMVQSYLGIYYQK